MARKLQRALLEPTTLGRLDGREPFIEDAMETSVGRSKSAFRGALSALATLILSMVFTDGAAHATTFYVDGNCNVSGSGLTTSCGPNGPKTTIDGGIALLSAGGDILEIRGVHAPHDGET